MAEASISVAQDQFNCSICLDLLKNPVTIPCGHSYCMDCITNCWNQEDQKRIYSCPQCRQTFTTRPVLNKNVVFAEMVEKLKNTRLRSSHVSAHCYAGSGDVECDVCTERKLKAVKSCLVCLNSYCQNHLDQHENFFKSKKHKVIDATGRLQEMICRKHDKQLEIYCRTDDQCICYLCTMDEHKNHDTVTAVAEKTRKQTLLLETQRKFQERIQEREKDLQELRQAVDSHKRSAQTAVEDSERIFTQLIRSIERRRSEVTQLIRDQEKTVVSRAEGVLKRLEQEIDDLRRRDTELKQFLHTDDHIHFLQSFKCFSVTPESSDVSSITVSSQLSFDEVRKSVSKLKEKLEDFCKEEIENISGGEPKTREEFLQYSSLFSLDPNTANKIISLSENNSVATCTNTVQQYPDHPDRFDHWLQVLCRESVCGRCYWEVERSGVMGISVSYKNIKRKGEGYECLFGFNDQSWRLYCTDSTCSFKHNRKQTNLPVVSSSCRIGVYVDHRAGILSFYSVSDTMTLIHRVQTTFTQPLHAGFWINPHSTVKLCSLTG
ncbi:tripartite motif-containing protein 16-like protein isoform X2 [Triplophysa dalaica]|uniref:tripartite motif-containing protein 16-like protein isoform X2 n=1 Tax=Triplophysa dalaica TaxID=1582913 RepID=UPI0024DF8520|nr:tripartite motif-containing protein 16-like protein isoform X2 [Triplophysa dalaica]